VCKIGVKGKEKKGLKKKLECGKIINLHTTTSQSKCQLIQNLNLHTYNSDTISGAEKSGKVLEEKQGCKLRNFTIALRFPLKKGVEKEGWGRQQSGILREFD